MDTSGTSATRDAVGITTYSSLKDGQTPKVTLRTKYGIDSSDKSDFVNENTQYKGSQLKVGDTTLDDYDFITLKFTSIAKGESVNFRATLSGLTETTTPSWDSAKFIGSPFPYWTYSGIERSVSFNFKVYSTTPLQHIAAWQRLNFLTSLAYPQAYNKGIAVIAPFLRITIGNLYKNKECYISQLSYTVDDNGTWEVGPTAGMGMADNQEFSINGESTTLNNYKLPKVIDVSVTLNLVESKSSTQHGYLYGFDKLPRVAKMTNDTTGKSAEAASDANTKNSISQTEAKLNTSVSKADTINASAKVNNPGQSTTTSTAIGSDAKKVETAVGGTKIEAGAEPKKVISTDDPVKGKFAKTYVTKSPPQSSLLIYTKPSTKKPGQFIATAYLNGQQAYTGISCKTNEAAVKYLEDAELKSL